VVNPARHDEPPRPPSGRLRRWLVSAFVMAGLALVLAALAVRQRPVFHGESVGGAAAQAAARRFVTKAAALHEAVGRPGSWDMVFTQDECNAWLTEDLPRRTGLLPTGWAEPQVRFGPDPGAIEAAAVVTRAGLLPGWLLEAVRPVVMVRLQVRLVALGRLECRIVRAHAGLLPLPRGPLLHLVAAALERHGMVCEMPRVDGRSVLMVTLPSGGQDRPAIRVAALAVSDGELLISGTTLER
jgi:hypothetical protein